MNRLLRPEVYRWPRLGQQLRTTSNGVRVRSPEQHREQQDPTRRAENSSSSGVPKKKKCVILSDRPISAVSVEVRSCKRTVLLKRPAVSVHRPNRTSSKTPDPEKSLKMVYDSDFYTTRRVGSSYTRPTISSYTVTTPRYSSSYTTSSDVGAPRRDESSYSYSKTVRSETSSSSADPYSSRPSTSTSSYSSTSERNSRGGPGGYSYSSERTSTTGGGPGGYSYSSTTSGRLPHGTTYRHYSYRV